MALHLQFDLDYIPRHVSSFLDTVLLAHQLENHFGRVNCALLLGEYGDVLDFCLLTDDDDSVTDAAQWVEDVKRLGGYGIDDASSAILLTAGHLGAMGSAPGDLAVLDQLRARLHTVGLYLRDWVQSCTGTVRSVTLAGEAPARIPSWEDRAGGTSWGVVADEAQDHGDGTSWGKALPESEAAAGGTSWGIAAPPEVHARAA